MEELKDPLINVAPKKPPPIEGLHEILTGRKKEESIYKLYCVRWFLLFAFSLASFTQCVIWITYSPIQNATILYYGLCSSNESLTAYQDCAAGYGKNVVTLLLNWGPIFYLASLPLVIIVSRAAGSTRKIILWSVSLCLACAAVRLIPGSSFYDAKSPGSIYFVHAGQILNACVGPLVMATPSLVSSTWFAVNERTTATAIMICSNNLGAAAGFFAPLVVEASGIRTLLWIQFGLSAAAFVMCLCIPAAPPTPPSGTASSNEAASCKQIGQDFCTFSKSCSAMVLALVGGLTSGIFNCWSGTLDGIIQGPTYTTVQKGWFGFFITIALICGAVTVGPVVDRFPFFKRRQKTLLLGLTSLSACVFTLLVFMLPFHGEVYIPGTFSALLTVFVVAGLFLGAALPLFYELLVEMMFPLSEEMGGLVLTVWNNIGGILLLAATAIIPSEYSFSLTILMAGSLALAVAGIACSKVEYRRMNQDQSSRPHDETTGQDGERANTNQHTVAV